MTAEMLPTQADQRQDERAKALGKLIGFFIHSPIDADRRCLILQTALNDYIADNWHSEHRELKELDEALDQWREFLLAP